MITKSCKSNNLTKSLAWFSSNLCLLVVFVSNQLSAQPMYEEGTTQVLGVTLLQDYIDKNQYYYIPPSPRLSQKPDSTFEIMCIKYTGKAKESNGGLFHALIEFQLSQEELALVEKELKKKNSNAGIKGPISLLDNTSKNGEEIEPSFRIVSGVLSNIGGKESMTSNVVYSGKAPMTSGGKAAIAAQLNQAGATLLWNSLQSNTSDVSVVINGYYEAMVKGYNATVTANADVYYSHFSELKNNQGGYTKSQIRKIVDSLSTKGGIKIDVFDRSQALNLKTGDMESILSIVTNKLVEAMFNEKTGWMLPPPEVNADLGYNEAGKSKQGILERVGEQSSNILASLNPIIALQKGISGILSPSSKNKYISDNQYVLKDIKDVRQHKFELNLSKTTSIKVPINTAGNLSGFYDKASSNSQYFKIVNMEDPSFQRKEVSILVDGNYQDGFGEYVNAVSVNFRKRYGAGNDDLTARQSFFADEIKKGVQIKTIEYPRLGIVSDQWEEYEYQIKWSLPNEKVLNYPKEENKWINTNSSIINIGFPLEKSIVYIDMDREIANESKLKTVVISFAGSVFEEKRKLKDIIIRSNDAELNKKITLYHDPSQKIVYNTTWYYGDRTVEGGISLLKESNYITLIPKQ